MTAISVLDHVEKIHNEDTHTHTQNLTGYNVGKYLDCSFWHRHHAPSGLSMDLVVDVVRIKIEQPHDKTNKMTVGPVKTQISLGFCPV